MSPVTQTHKSQQFRLFLKISLISIIVLLLMIPKMMIESINSERQRRGQDVQHEIAQSWGHEQIIASPILSIPTQINYGNDHYGTKTLHIAPKTCNINTDIEPSIRKKSIYECVLYTAQNSIEATYTLPDIKSLDERIETIFWDRATIDIGTSDASRIAEQVELTWDDHNIPMKAGASHSSLFSQAIHAKVPIDTTQKTFALQTKIILHGSESVKFTRLADQMNVTINSPWSDPGFVGSPLPRSRDINDAGFTAEWATNAYSQAKKSQ